jgi:hypothetical protein
MSTQDPYVGIAQANYPPRRALAITPADGVLLTNFFRKVYVGGTGDLKVTMAGDGPAGTPVVIKAVPVGVALDIQVCIVWATGTSATLLVGFFD